MTVPAQTQIRWSWERPDILPERLKVLREAFSFSPVTAGLAVGCSDQTWRNYESGATTAKEPTLAAIAMAFERDGDRARALKEWLLHGGPMPPQPHPPEETLRLSREPGAAGQDHFSGSDINFLCAATITAA